MSKLDVTDALIRTLIREVAPLVSHLTGWNLEIAGLGVRVLPRHRGYEEIVVGRLQAAGLAVDPDHSRGAIERLFEHMLEDNIIAAYDHGRRRILVVRENVDDSNMDGLRLILCHELVHRGQHVRHAGLFERLDVVVREAYTQAAAGNPSAALPKLQEAEKQMTVMESHARFVETEIKRLYLPRAVPESHFNILTLLFRFLGKRKLSQYVNGIPAVAQATQAGKVDDLYRGLG